MVGESHCRNCSFLTPVFHLYPRVGIIWCPCGKDRVQGPKGWPLLGIWPSGIWSNIFSANMMDVWYDVTSGKDSNDFPVDVQNSGRRGMLKWGAWAETIPLWRLVEEGVNRQFWAPHMSNVCYPWCREGVLSLSRNLLWCGSLMAGVWNSSGPGI